MTHTSEIIEPWKKGIKLQFLISWSEQQGFPPYITTREVCETFIKPVTQTTQLSYCEQLLLSEDTAEFVGCPSAFISHAWEYHFVEVVEALTSYFASEEDVIIWFDIFGLNMHKSTSFDFEWWSGTFKNAIHSFGRTVMVLAPWNDPLPLKRGWCIWELYCTILVKREDERCLFDVAMSPASIEHFIADVDADPVNVINRMLATIDTARSECIYVYDRDQIHYAIQKTVGFNELNKEIFEIMRGWVISQYEANCKGVENLSTPVNLTSMNSLAILYANQGEYGKALPLHQDCLRIRKVILGEHHPDTLASMNNLANLYKNQGEYGKALPLYEECLIMRKVVLGEHHPDTLDALKSLAIFYDNQGEYERALPLYEESLRMGKVLLGEHHPHTLAALNNLASLYKNQGEDEKAVPLYAACLGLGRVVLGGHHLHYAL